jgi:hypothetical protein
MRSARAIASVLILLGAHTLAGQGARMQLGEILLMAPSTTADGGSARAFVFQADRGSRKGQYLHVWTGAAKAPRPPAPPNSSEYHLVNPVSAGPLPAVDVLGIHYIKVRPDREAAFDTFVGNTLHKAVANLRPDLRLLYYKAVSGPQVGSYITIFALTRESRDKYWPGGSDSDALRAAFEPVKPLTKDLLTYLVEGSALTDPKFAAAVYESRDWSDFVLISGTK